MARGRKIKVGGVMRSFDELETLKATELRIGQSDEKDYKELRWRYKTDGDIEFFDEGEEGDDDIIFGGSKSDLRRLEDIERNISVLANKVVTVSDTNDYESGVDDNFGSIFDDKTRFKDEVRFSNGDIRYDSNTTVEFRGDVTFYNNTIDGVKTPTSNLHAANKKFVDDSIAALADSAPSTLNTLNELASALGDDENFSTTVTNSIATKLGLAGGTLTGDLILSGAPTSNLMASTKKYVDDTITSSISGKLDASGGTLTGALVLSGAPTADLHPATKKYVDDLGFSAIPRGSFAIDSTDGAEINVDVSFTNAPTFNIVNNSSSNVFTVDGADGSTTIAGPTIISNTFNAGDNVTFSGDNLFKIENSSNTSVFNVDVSNNNTTIATALNINNAVTIEGDNNFTINNSSSNTVFDIDVANNTTVIGGATTVNNDFAITNNSNTNVFDVDVTANTFNVDMDVTLNNATTINNDLTIKNSSNTNVFDIDVTNNTFDVDIDLTVNNSATFNNSLTVNNNNFNITNSSSTNIFDIDVSNNITALTTEMTVNNNVTFTDNSTNKFRIDNSSNNNVFNIDMSTGDTTIQGDTTINNNLTVEGDNNIIFKNSSNVNIFDVDIANTTIDIDASLTVSNNVTFDNDITFNIDNSSNVTVFQVDGSSGDVTIGGTLTLSGAPSADLQAATKKYVDDATSNASAMPTAGEGWGEITSSSDNTVDLGSITGDSSLWEDLDIQQNVELSVVQNSASGTGSLTYTPMTGILSYTPPAVSSGGASTDASFIPDSDDVYDLGSPTKRWRDLYLGPGSLYINNKKVIEDNSDTITITTSQDQDLKFQTSGLGDVEIATSTAGGNRGKINLAGNLTIGSSFTIAEGSGSSLQVGSDIDMNSNTVTGLATPTADSDAATKAYVDQGSFEDITASGDVTVSGNLTVSGTTTTINTETISLADNMIDLNSDFTSGTPTEDTGIRVMRGDSTNKTLLWDETNDRWTVGSETFVAGAFVGDGSGLTGIDAGSSVTNSDTAPSSPSDGDMWFNTTDTQLYVYYNDGSSSQWVSTAGSGLLNVNNSIIPTADDTYDLGSTTHRFRDLYLGPGSLYVNNKKVISDESDTMEFKTDEDQNLRIKTTGTGDLELESTAGIQLKGSVQLLTGKRIIDSAGTNVEFGDNIEMNSNKITGLGTPTANTDAATKAYVDSLDVSGQIPTNVSELTNDAGYITSSSVFSGDYTDLSNKPTIPTNVSDLTNDAGYLTSETDSQTLSFSSPNLSISNGNSADLSALSKATGFTTSTSNPSSPSVGDAYFNTSDNMLKIWNGSSWGQQAFSSDGTISGAAAESAKQIRDDGHSTGNGVYWLKGDNGQAFQAYCDMTTAGGGWVGLMNIDTQSGNNHHYSDNSWWLYNNSTGSPSTFLTSETKSGGWYNFSNFTEIMIMVHNEGSYRAHGVWSLVSTYNSYSMHGMMNISASSTGTVISGNRTAQGGSTGFTNNPNRNGNSTWLCEFTDPAGGYELRVNWYNNGPGAKYSMSSDTVSHMRLSTGMGDPNGPSGHGGYEHSYSGLGGHHERGPGSYVLNFDYAAYTEYCDTPVYMSPNAGNQCGGSPLEGTGLDCAIFVR